MIPEFPQTTAKDASVSINYKYFPVNYASHRGKSLSGIVRTQIKMEFDHFIYRTGEMNWDYCVLLLLDFNNKLTIQTLNVFAIGGCYEDMLYAPGMVGSVIKSSLSNFPKEVKKYAKLHGISNLPEPEMYSNYTKDLEEMCLPYVAKRVLDGGLISLKSPVFNHPYLTLTPGYENEFIFKTIFSIFDKLILHPDFNNADNKYYLTRLTPLAHLLTVKQRAFFHMEKDKVVMSVHDAVVLALMTEMALQCVSGMLWTKLQPLMLKEGFTAEKELEFLKKGKVFFDLVKSKLEKNVKNFSEIPIWEDRLQ